MRPFLSKRRYEVLAVLAFAVFGVVHGQTSEPLMGLTAEKGGALHRLVQNLDGRVTTLIFRLRGPRPAHPDVVVMEIDERGAQRYGLWPWPREVVAKALERLLDADAKVIGLDIAFSDPSQVNTREAAWLETLRGVEALPPALAPLKAELEDRVRTSPDEVLEAAFKRGGPRIVQGVVPFAAGQASSFTDEQRKIWKAELAGSVISRVPGSVKGFFKELPNLDVYPNIGAQAPIPRFAAAGSRLGHFSTVPDIDSTIRRSPLLTHLEEPPGLLPSLALQVVAAQLDAQIVPEVPYKRLEGIRLVRAGGDVLIPVEGESPMTLINYPGDEKAFQRVSVVDVIDGKFDKALVAGKAVLVGVTIIGSSGDQRVTPFSEFTAGVYTHASLVSNTLRGDFLSRPEWLNWLEWFLMLVLGLAVAVITPRVRNFAGKMVLIVAVIAGFSVFTFVLFVNGLKLNWVVPALHLTVTAFGTIFLGYLSVDREKLKMRSTFSRYLGEDVMDVALEHPDRLNRGEKREMTVLFSDIRGFTSLSEHMSPEKLADFINQYLSPMTQIVFDEKGTLDKYIGDAVMAFWNAPLDQADHALRACRAAVHMLERLEELKAEWRKAGLPELEIGIGINTGQMVVGNMGSDVRVDYTVLGDSVNLGSRLEGTNKEYETRIIISEWTRGAVKEGIITRRLGAVRVKGKKMPVGIFELRGLGTPNEVEGRAIAAFEAGLTAMTERRFDDATRAFTEVLAIWPGDAPARNYLEELETFKESPPPADWDGVVSLKTK
ncbi:MAG: adenylate/guanylate cyclase domain-containing protein [Archangium sp.]|nr:adenylate/guanylate cyclase domain-containing protein [Archangium sp.]